MADDGAVAQFTTVTGADAQTAAFYLSSANGDMDTAVSAYFESGGAAAPSSYTAPVPVPSAAGGSSAPPRPSASSSRGVATLGTLGAGGSDDDDESGKNYYAGGEKSGQMIQDPRGRRGRGGPAALPAPAPAGDDEAPQDGDLAEAIFERARARGPPTDAERDEFAAGAQSFAGAGYRLGDAGAPARSEGTAPDVVGRRNVTRTLTFYSNGFVVDEGELREFEDPANAAFLNDVRRGFVPKEMEEAGVGNVSINLVDKKTEEYVPPKPRLVPFAGGGNRLGSASAAPAAAPAAPSAPPPTLAVDEASPVASVQVRLADGSRLVARLNHTHTVQDLVDFVRASRPAAQAFTLATTFPRKVLDDMAASIKDAGLSGAVVVQTLK